MDIQHNSSPTSTKDLFKDIDKAFHQKNTSHLFNLFKDLYSNPSLNSQSEAWKISSNQMNYESTPFSSAFGKMVESIRQFQLEKLKKGIHCAFKIHIDVLSYVLKIMDEIKDDSKLWICKPLRQIIRETKRIFLAASKKDQESGGKESVKLDALVRKFQEFKSRRTFTDDVKKEIIPLIDNLQVSIMFVFHNYSEISRIIDSTKSYGEHGAAFIDNYYFQKGKTALIYENFQAAEEYFELIKIKTKGQKRLVLKYLIPCKMFLGKFFERKASNEEEYFPEYDSIIEALQKAKFKDYDIAIQKFQKVWIKRGIYLLMDKLRIILWRNLLKKVHNIIEKDQIPIEIIQKAVILSGGDESLEECTCIISNLIYEKCVKGYVFQNEEKKVLVLKKGGEGFPSLSKGS